MNTGTVLSGYIVSTLGGALVLWLIIDLAAWTYLERHGIPKKRGLLTPYLGLVERAMYTTVFILEQPSFIAVWLALKVAAQWSRWHGEERDTYNVFLIGNAISIGVGFAGAWVGLQRIPLLPAP